MVPTGVATNIVRTATFTDVQVAPIQSLKPSPVSADEKKYASYQRRDNSLGGNSKY